MADDEKSDKTVHIGGSVINSNIVVGDHNIINVEALKLKTVASLFTIRAPVQDFTGRAKELEKLKASFANGAIITGLSGGGGIGKTELARKLAQVIADNYPDARMEINLQGISENPLSSDEAMRRLIEPFYPNQKLPDDPNQLKGLYDETFKSRKALLLLDNAANAAQVRPLIPPAHSAAIITSRQHFTLSEFGFKDPLRLDELSPDEALTLLRSASEKMKEASDAKSDELASLCGYLPLALRVAAALLNDSPWTLDTLIVRLKDERTRLERLKREDDRDLDVEATLNLSYNLLDERLKKYFRMASVFSAPFPDISARAVWGMGEEDDVDGVLNRLVNRSLLNFLSEHEGDGGLYALHDLTRLFGIKHLLENEEEARQAISNHAEHFLSWASAAEAEYQKGSKHVLIGLNYFRFIWPHLWSAYERFLPGQKTFPRSESADRWLSDFPGRCADVLDLQLPPRRKIPILQNALEAARRLADKVAEGVHLGNLGLAYADLGDARKAIEFYEQILVIHREIGDRRGEGADLGNMGLAYAALGNAHKAIESHEKALVTAREIGDRRGEGNDLGNLGLAYAALGDAHQAIGFHEQALAIVREIGDRRGEGTVLGNLGLAYAALGDAHQAIGFYEQALAIDREIGDRRGEGSALGNLGNAYDDLGNVRKAIMFYEQQLIIVREIGNRRGEGAGLGNLGLAYAALGEARKAIEFYGQALTILREIGDRRGEGVDLCNLGNVYAALGDAHKAIEFYEQALAIDREIGDRRGEGNDLGNLGLVYKDLGDKEKAGKYWEEALLLFHAIESPNEKSVQNLLNELDGEPNEEPKGITEQEFVQRVISAAKNHASEAAGYFDGASKMARDPDASPEIQELGKVLQRILTGFKNPDLSHLPEELANLIKTQLEK
jgi:tetratricopeptide (TPR) repeat protein